VRETDTETPEEFLDRTGGEEVFAYELVEDDPPSEGCTELPEGITQQDVSDWYNATAQLVGGTEAALQLCALFQTGIPEAIEHSASEIPPPDAGTRWAWPKLRAHYKLALDAQAVADLGCGASGLGTVLCGPNDPLPSEQEFIVVTHILDDVIPIDSTEYFGQYGFVFDQNGQDGDNYVAASAYPNDFYQGTDRWYSLDHYPGEGAFFGVLDATNGQIQPYPSAARLIVSGATLIAIIPASEMAVECPELRVTAFTHRGDYGFSAPNFWAGDTEPTVFEALDQVCG
jgi:hypothetical protein